MSRAFFQRRPFAMSIAVLLVLAIAVSIGVAYRQGSQYRKLRAEILRHGTYFEFARSAGGFGDWLRTWRDGRTSNRIVELHGPEIDDAWLREWDHLQAVSPTSLTLKATGIAVDELAKLIASNDELWSLGLQNAPINDAVVAALRSRSMLQHLDLTGSMLTEEQWAQLSLGGLRSLSVARTAVTSEALVGQLPECTSMHSIGIDGRQCDAATVDALVKLGRVDSISLSGADVTDEDLEQISALQLRSLYLVETTVTDEGISKLQALQPQCQVRVFGTE